MKILYRLMQKENIMARILSIIIACGLWIYVMTDQNPIIERSIDVKLDQVNVEDSKVVFDAPERVTVKVRAARSFMNDDIEKSIIAQIDLKDINEGQIQIPVKVRFTKGDVVSVTPKDVSVYVDTISEKSVPVKTRVVGSSADDLVVGTSNIEPADVTVKGATHKLNMISKVVAPIDITNQKGDFSTVSELVAVSDDGYDIPSIQVIPEKVKVQAKMVKQLISVDLPIKLVMSGILPDGIVVSQTEVVPETVKVTGPPSIVKNLKEIKTKPVDVTTVTGSTSIIAELDIPEKVIPHKNKIEVRFSVER